jgi:hypothetical protein
MTGKYRNRLQSGGSKRGRYFLFAPGSQTGIKKESRGNGILLPYEKTDVGIKNPELYFSVAYRNTLSDFNLTPE